MARKSKRLPEQIEGSFSAIPHAVLDSQAFMGATDKAKSLLFALMRQINGRNNGHLHLTDKWLHAKGWTSTSQNKKARDELLDRRLIVQTFHGGLNSGCDKFAVTWMDISNFVGTELSAQTYHKGAWGLCNLPATKRRAPPQKQKTPSVQRSSAAPYSGAVNNLATPYSGAKTALFDNFTTPYSGNNVIHHLQENVVSGDVAAGLSHPARRKTPIVGKAGRSGKKL
jgi:hypothetical protein